MYVVIRSYSGEAASEIFDLIEERFEEFKGLVSQVPGFVSYTAFRGHGGGTAVTVCEDKEGTDQSTKVAARWVLENITQTPPVPQIEEGSVVAYTTGD
jgi:heme-degrading monooxygenase HmoA